MPLRCMAVALNGVSSVYSVRGGENVRGGMVGMGEGVAASRSVCCSSCAAETSCVGSAGTNCGASCFFVQSAVAVRTQTHTVTTMEKPCFSTSCAHLPRSCLKDAFMPVSPVPFSRILPYRLMNYACSAH